MLRITDFYAGLDYDDAEILKRLKKILNTEVKSFRVVRRAVDARRIKDVHYSLTIEAKVENEQKVLQKNLRGVTIANSASYSFFGGTKLKKSPIVVGSGPAGLFCALFLARDGQKPIVLERGADVDTRTAAVENYWSGGRLDETTNVQFGEGGAGTFSDGKLTTGIKDIRIRAVLEEFVRFGAPGDILINAKPHIGTDILRNVVKNIRNEIIGLGGEVRFNTRLCDIRTENGKVVGAVVEKGKVKSEIEAEKIVLAIGHSARDTVEMLLSRGVLMRQKPFSVGVRVEHSQQMISNVLYGESAKKLPPADYKMAVHLPSGRSLYTFCMCPGGYVVAAASEKGMICTNGMSYSDRGGKNANSALLVGVYPSDFDSDDPLAGIEFQREIERRAYAATNGVGAPAQMVGDFIQKQPSVGFGAVEPTYRPKAIPTELDGILPDFVCDTLREGIVLMDRKIRGFASSDAVMTAPETRSSSPVQFIRDENMQLSVKGLYSAGEGGGHAGGITSSAVEGIKAAEAVVQK